MIENFKEKSLGILLWFFLVFYLWYFNLNRWFVFLKMIISTF